MLNLGHVGHGIVGGQAGMPDHEVRRHVERLLNARLGLLAPLLRSRDALFRAGALLARFGQSLNGGGRGLVELGLPVLGFLKPVGRVPA